MKNKVFFLKNISRKCVKNIINVRPSFSFLKCQKFNYNKRMTPTKNDMNKDRKIVEDLNKMNDLTDFSDLALTLQSDLFHETLFQNLRASIKSDRDLKIKVKDMAFKLGLKADELQTRYVDSFNVYLKEFFEHTKGMIRDKAKDNPKILEADPVWVEKLKTPEGFLEYLDKFQIDLTEEKWYTYPEVNQMFLEMNPEQLTQSFADLYFNGILDEEQMRIYPHVSAMKDYLRVYDQSLDDTLTINNEMWVDKLKSDTFNYIKHVLSPEFKTESLSYAKSMDNMRVDCGLLISRDPIFVDTRSEDMEFGKYRRHFFKKHLYNVEKHLEDISSFNDVTSDYWDVCSSQFKINADNKPNIRKFNKDKNAYDFYCLNSKHWSLVDPNATDTKSIQYAGLNRSYMLCKNKKNNQWEFPTMTLYNGDNFDDTKFRLFFCLTQEEFKLYYPSPYPCFQVTRDFHEHEKADPKNKGLSGVRTFYYDACHFRGAPKVTPNVRHPYVDHVFTSKKEINKYVPENYWHAVISSLQEK